MRRFKLYTPIFILNRQKIKLMKFKIFLRLFFIMIIFAALSPSGFAQRGRVTKVKVVNSPRGKVIKVRPHVNRKAHVRYAALPRWGTTVTVVPAGAIVIGTYHFHNGVYYTKRNNGFVVVHPGRGIRIRVLPVGYRTIIIGPKSYYYYYGTFYSKVVNAEEYEVVEAPDGAIVDALPDGYEVKTKDGNEYYVLDGIYYGEVDASDIEGGIGYKVIKL
jgi:hypothetical protein